MYVFGRGIIFLGFFFIVVKFKFGICWYLVLVSRLLIMGNRIEEIVLKKKFF